MLPEHLIDAQTKQVMVKRQLERYCQEMPGLASTLPRSEEEFSPYLETKQQIYAFMSWLTGVGDIELRSEVHNYAREYGLKPMDALIYLAVEKAIGSEFSRSTETLPPRERLAGEKKQPWEEYMDKVFPGWDLEDK